jgi:putative peptidoglycan lipid II flippase
LNFRVTQADLLAANQMLLSLGSAVLAQGAVVVDRIVSSFLPEGSIAVLGYARTLIEVIIQVFLSSAPIALMPSLAASLACKAQEEVSRKLGQLFSFMSGISIPVTAYLILLSQPLVSLLYQRGSFHQEATLLTALILSFYAPGILLTGYFRTIEFYLYADLRAKQVLLLFSLFGIGTAGFDVLLAQVAGVRGIALAYSIALSLPLLIGFGLVRRSMTAGTQRSLLVLNVKIVGACMVALLASWIFGSTVKLSAGLPPTVEQLISAALLSAVYLGVLSLMMAALRVQEFKALLAFLIRRIPQVHGA